MPQCWWKPGRVTASTHTGQLVNSKGTWVALGAESTRGLLKDADVKGQLGNSSNSLALKVHNGCGGLHHMSR